MFKFNIHDSLTHLKQGNVLLCPTDTIWGLSCDATNQTAVQKIANIKQRDIDKSFIVLVSSLDMMGLYVKSFPNFAVDIIEFSSQPLTVVFPEGVKLAPQVINADGSVAIRLIKPVDDESQFCYELIRKFNRPVVSTSANISGETAPRLFGEISEAIRQQVDYIVPFFHGANQKKAPSKIIKLNEDGTFKIIRN